MLNNFSLRLKYLRERSGMTQKEVAEKIGLTQAGYGKIENGKREPNLDTLFKLKFIFEESLDFIIGCSDQDVRASQLYELYAEARTRREESEEDLVYWEEAINAPDANVEKYSNLIRKARDEVKEYSQKENKSFEMFFEHLMSIPGVEDKYATKEFWINRHKEYVEGDKQLYREFWEEFEQI